VDAWAVALQAEAFPNEFGDLRELTVHAPEVWETQPVVIPPFLRTREYSWAVLRPSYFDLSDGEVEAMVEEEMSLRAAMTGPEGPSLRVVLNETVLRRPQGGAEVLNAQRDFLSDLVAAGIVRLGMIPEKSPRHPELGGPFRLMEYGDRAPIVYAFAAQDGELITDAEQVLRCSMIRDAIEEVVTSLAPVLTGRPLNFDISDGQVVVDRAIFARTLSNLLSNAAKYSRPGTPIHIRTLLSGDQATVEVIDEGIGMTPDEVQQAFQPFWRAGRPGARRVRGAGIGLSLVAEYVRLLEGTYGVRSEPGRGSTFHFTVRLAGARAPLERRP
jgi:two-component sensor histidine kinase